MKKLLVLAFLNIGLPYILNSQTTNKIKKFRYKSWVHRFEAITIQGSIYKLQEDSIALVNREYLGNSRYGYKTYKVPIQDINIIKVRKKGKVIKGMFFGLLGGFVAGGTLGYLDGDDPTGGAFTAEQKFWLLGILSTIPGAIIGGIIAGSAKIEIPLWGDKVYYQDKKQDLQKYLVE